MLLQLEDQKVRLFTTNRWKLLTIAEPELWRRQLLACNEMKKKSNRDFSHHARETTPEKK
jgi:hypothetical protein